MPIAIGGGVCQLWADAHEIACNGAKDRSCGFDGDRLSGISQTLGKRLQVIKDHRLAPGDDDMINGRISKFC